jgi:hypothetical protein
MKTILKITAGILLAATILVVGCGALVAGSIDSTSPVTSTPSTKSTDEPAKSESNMTPDQERALDSARSYIEISGFSRKGLIRQLSSEAADGYSRADATFAADNVGADWKAEAVESAKQYLDTMSFSRDGLMRQLTSSAGDQYTEAEARYAVEKVY